MNTSSRTTRRNPRTFEIRGAQWVESTRKGPGAGPRIRFERSLAWVLVPVAMVAFAGVILLLFAVLVTLLAAGILTAWKRSMQQAARLRARRQARRPNVPMRPE